MDVEFHSTKMNDLSVEDWLPNAATLEARYRALEKTRDPQPCACLNNVTGDKSQLPSARVDAKSSLGEDGSGFVTVGVPAQSHKRRKTDSESSDCNQPQPHMYSRQPRIPVEYVHALCAKATLMPVPLKLHTVGRITIFLDDCNYIQLINLTVRQVM